MENFKFQLMWRDELIADVDVRETEVYIKRYIIHPVKQIFYADKISRFEFGDILKSRCWDENRANLQKYLNAIGLDEFNPYLICRKTHGVMLQDSVWFRYEGENLSWKDVKPFD